MTTDALALLLQLAPKAHPVYREAFAAGWEPLRAAGMIERPRRLRHFLAQCSHESAGWTRVEENLQYTSAERIKAVWPSRFRTIDAAQPYVRQPEDLANKVYGGRMGNTAPGDGWRYRGRGPIMTTGHDNYRRVGRLVCLDLELHPEDAIHPTHVLPVAIAIWRMLGCDAPADADDLLGVTKRINGGTHGLADRRRWLAKVTAALAAQE